jgi:Transcription elongation factor, N-terminal
VADRVEHLTAAQKADLERELGELEGPKRAQAVQAIKTARGFGDLSENFEYHAAKNEQGLLERRITILRNRLQGATLIDEEAAAASDRSQSARGSSSIETTARQWTSRSRADPGNLARPRYLDRRLTRRRENRKAIS